ncbi:MAG: SGNH/GDSL hydrolase family protein [Leptospirales bacterium]|nr:SGNH/GDSL hydrolase family protein [Leptospirales bacterium]
MRSKGYLQNLSLVFFSVFLTYFVVEIVYSLSGYSVYRRGKAVFQWLVYDSIQGWMNLPHYNHDGNFRIDRNGFRIVERAPVLADQTIVCLGDSGTFGFWADGTWPRFPNFPDKLQESLDARTYRIVNAGVIGYTSSHILRQYMVRVRKLKPHTIVIRIGFNDHSPSWDIRRAVRDPDSSFKRFLIYSMGSTFTVQTAVTLKQIGEPDRAMEIPWNTISQFKENLTRLVDYARADGVRVVLLDYPIRPPAFPGRVDQSKFPTMGWGVRDYQSLLELHRPYTEAIREIAQVKQVPLIETAPELESRQQEGFSETDIVHPNEKGYSLIAKAVARFLGGR